MLFGVRLANEIYSPWKEDYLGYDKLKKLLKEGVLDNGDENENWTENDETRFVSALDEELEKVYSFESQKYNELSERIAVLEKQVEDYEKSLVTVSSSAESTSAATINPKEMESEMESILEIATQLDHFSRLNFTGFVKIVKKHDRLHRKYQVRPLLHVRLNALPFHNEDYSPLLYRLSAMYSFLSVNFGTSTANGGKNGASAKMSSFTDGTSDFTSYRFWVHPENLMEVKTKILRHLPALVYNPEGEEENKTPAGDPKFTSLYFDNSQFELYESQLQKRKSNSTSSPSLSSLRLKWYGKLADKPDILLERKDGDFSPIKLKEKHIDSFLGGESMYVERAIRKMKDRGHVSQAEVESYERMIKDIQTFIKNHKLSPVLRTTYTRTAFQIPGDDRVRICLDSDITFIREDCFDSDRPIREPDHWRRSDLDVPEVEDPLSMVRKSEYTKFPFSVLELRLKIRENSNNGVASGSGSTVLNSEGIGSHSAWIEELISSELIKEVPQFSKYVQGIASLFAEDDRLDVLPFWLPDLEHDIRKDPKEVFKVQRQRLRDQRNELARQESIAAGVSGNTDESDNESVVDDGSSDAVTTATNDTTEEESSGAGSPNESTNTLGIPTWERARLEGDSEDEEVILPPGISRPTTLLRNQGQVKVETKVWLANERTFNKWLSVTTLLSVMTFSLYNSVEKAASIPVAEKMAYMLFGLTIFSGIWGYVTYMRRLNFIRERSERHLDSSLGPIIVALGLIVALSVNFYYSYKAHSKAPLVVDSPAQNATIHSF